MATKRCPMCRNGSSEHSPQCGSCGYTFGQPVETTRALLREQMRGAKGNLIGALLLDLMFAGVVAAMVISGAFFGPIHFWLGALVLVTIFNVRAVDKLLMTRASLRSLARQFPGLPKAQLVSTTATQHEDREAERQ